MNHLYNRKERAAERFSTALLVIVGLLGATGTALMVMHDADSRYRAIPFAAALAVLVINQYRIMRAHRHTATYAETAGAEIMAGLASLIAKQEMVNDLKLAGLEDRITQKMEDTVTVLDERIAQDDDRWYELLAENIMRREGLTP